jgi:hypothetical protein
MVMETEVSELDSRAVGVTLLALFLPFILWPIEWYLPYPAIIEEVAKLMIVVMIVRFGSKQLQVPLVLGAGILFAASETLLYVINAAQYGNLTVLGWRLVLTVPMHLISFFILLWAVREKIWWAGLAIVTLIHWGFNFAAGK